MTTHIRHLRWWIAVLLLGSTLINYLDRNTLSTLAETIREDWGMDKETFNRGYSRVTAAFLFSYAVMYAVGGGLVDRLGTRVSLFLFASLWSAMTLAHGLARTMGHLVLARFGLGIAQPANFPAGVRAVSEWFPMRERALGVGIFNAGTALGSVSAIILSSWIARTWGWRWAFLAAGAISLVWVAAWARIYRLPRQHPRISPEELALIEEGGGAAAITTPAIPWSRLLRMRETWGCVAARILTDPISYFLSFWIPMYFQRERGFDLKQIGWFVWIPPLALFLGSMAGGAIPRLLIASGWTLNRARKALMLTISCLIPLLCLAIIRTGNPYMAVAILAAISFGHGAWGNITLPAEVFPRHVVGTVSGLGGCLGGLVGAISQLTIGRITVTSFTPIFVALGAIYFFGFFLVSWLVGTLGVIRDVDGSGGGEAAA